MIDIKKHERRSASKVAYLKSSKSSYLPKEIALMEENLHTKQPTMTLSFCHLWCIHNWHNKRKTIVYLHLN